MFDSSSWNRYDRGARRPRFGKAWRAVTIGGREIEIGENRESPFDVHIGYGGETVVTHNEEEEDRRGFRVAVLVAVLFHLALLAIHMPQREPALEDFRRDRLVYTVHPVKFKPPPPKAQQQEVPKSKRKTKRIPMPDPTPDDPEPIDREVKLPEFEVEDIDIEVAVPDAPPSPFTGGRGTGMEPYQVGGEVTPPVKIFAPQPPYTEDARKGRVQGVVILQTVVDVQGKITQIEVVKALPLGLTESAVAAVQQWQYKPAMLDGRPVPVYMTITVSFTMQ